MELFARQPQEQDPAPGASPAPLAWRMAPRDLDEFVGQEHLVGPGRPLETMLHGRGLTSLIFYGPPGTGKTALARLVARRSGAFLEWLNAVTAGVADLRRVVQAAESRRDRGPTLLFVDEIHRFSKVQQDALLPDVEQGRVILIGASTENPFFALIPALRSRCQILEFRALTAAEVRRILERALADAERGLGGRGLEVSDQALAHLAEAAGGDARRGLNLLEMAAAAAARGGEPGTVTLDLAREVSRKKALVYDRDGDAHYDMASALIKSMRGSDPDAAVYYLAHMLEAGEDPRFIARRVVIAASEDVGNADPRALLLADAALRAVERIGMPEARIILAQAVTYVATAPKSNAAYRAVDKAQADVREGRTLPVPDFLRDASYRGAAVLGRGRGYRYPHDYEGHFVPQEYLAEPRRYYEPSDQGYERTLRERLDRWRALRARGSRREERGGPPGAAPAPQRG